VYKNYFPILIKGKEKKPSTQRGKHSLNNYTQSLLKIDQNRQKKKQNKKNKTQTLLKNYKKKKKKKKNLKNKTSEKVLPILSKEVDLRSCLCTNSLP